MATLSIPTPFRPFTDGASLLEVEASDVGGAIRELVTKYPPLEQHLFSEDGELRTFVNLFINGEDIRYLDGRDTIITKEDKLRIIPSIAGGNNISKVDQSALKTNQSVIVALSLFGFLLNQPNIVALVAIFMLIGTLVGKPGFAFLYKAVLLPLGIVKPDVIADDPASHRFAQAVGVLFLAFALVAFGNQLFTLGWVFTWVVIALAFINLVSGFCLGCTIYYWIKRFRKNKLSSIKGTD